MENNGHIYILENYSIDNEESLRELREAYPHIKFVRITATIFTLQVEEGYEDELIKLSENVRYVNPPTVYGLNAEQALEISNISQFHEYPYGSLRGRGILIGFVDTGIDYQNDYFKYADNTSRIAAIWDQTIAGNPPEPFGYGSVYTQKDLDAALNSDNPYSIVPTRDTNGHGTYLAGIAAGNDQSEAEMFIGGAPDAEIIMVKLRQASKERREMYLINDTVTAYQSNDIISGVQFIVDTARQLNKPVVICLGVGNNYGSHSGDATIERYLEVVGKSNGVVVVVAAGNETSSSHHYRGKITSTLKDEVEINVGNNEEGFLMNLWANISTILRVSFRSPLGQVIDRIPLLNRTMQTFTFNLEPTILNIDYFLTDPGTGTESIAIRFKNPTPGIWTMIVESENTVDTTFHVWLPRRGFINEDTYFLQSDPNYTVQIPGTAEYVITVGAYDPIDNSIYVSSGRGPTTNNVVKPDFIAPSVNVQGPRVGGGFTTFIGTSTAAALTAAAAALLLEWSIVEGNFLEINTRIARGILIRGARRTENVIYPNSVEGYGRLDLKTSLTNL